MNQAYEVEILKRLREAVNKQKLELYQKIGFCTMTMLHFPRCFLSRSFWPQNQLLKEDTHHSPMILLRMTSGCF